MQAKKELKDKYRRKMSHMESKCATEMSTLVDLIRGECADIYETAVRFAASSQREEDVGGTGSKPRMPPPRMPPPELLSPEETQALFRAILSRSRTREVLSGEFVQQWDRDSKAGPGGGPGAAFGKRYDHEQVQGYLSDDSLGAR